MIIDVSIQRSSCFLCGGYPLLPVLDLGTMALTGVFPSSANDTLLGGPLRLVKCSGDCGLVQLAHSYPLDMMYGKGYGYRSSLNTSMVRHLQELANDAARFVGLNRKDIVLDIGCNDGTLLSFVDSYRKIGVDPLGCELDGVETIDSFFSKDSVLSVIGHRKAKLVTSIAMFYDIEDPIQFARDVSSLLADDGAWIIEQSYLPSMLAACAYDTVCHEHLAYYGVRQLKYVADRSGLSIADVTFNNCNGGSFRVKLTRQGKQSEQVDRLIKYESDDRLLDTFPVRVSQHRDQLVKTLEAESSKGRSVFGYGASTKGNVVLQYCGIDRRLIPYFVEVNPDKFGRVTPGSSIPIISESEAEHMKPEAYLVMPWHFMDAIAVRERDYIISGGSLIFPLPEIKIMRYDGSAEGCAHEIVKGYKESTSESSIYR